MAESKVLTTDELSKLQEFRNKDNQLVFNLGQTELQIQGLEEQKDQILEAAKWYYQYRDGRNICSRIDF